MFSIWHFPLGTRLRFAYRAKDHPTDVGTSTIIFETGLHFAARRTRSPSLTKDPATVASSIGQALCCMKAASVCRHTPNL